MGHSITIGKKSYSNAPPPAMGAWVQEFLTKLGGLNDFGSPNLRIVWGQSETRIAYGEKRMKYLAASGVFKTGERVDIATAMIVPIEERIDIGKPRWYIEEWYPPSLFKEWDEWEQGPFPKRGMYRHLLTLETENGQYRAPDKECLSWVREAWQKKQEARHLYDWREEAPQHFVDQANREGNQATADLEQERKDRLQHHFRDLLKPHIKKLMSPNPKKGKVKR